MAKLHFTYSTMNAGKSTALLQTNHGYKERGMNTMIFTSSKDDRYGNSEIVSRIGLRADAETFKETDNLFEVVKARQAKQTLNCVLIDLPRPTSIYSHQIIHPENLFLSHMPSR